jgi:hypothetical protein
VGALARRKLDPIYLLRKKLRGDFLQRMNPTPIMVRDYLQRLLPSAGTIEAADVEIGDIDEFLAFDAARRIAVSGDLPPEFDGQFALELLDGTPPHDGDWVRCSNFVVRRLAEETERA